MTKRTALVGVLAMALASSGAQAASPPAPIPTGDALATFSSSGSTGIEILTRTGKIVGTVPNASATGYIASLALSADRRQVYESLESDEQIPEIYDLDLASGTSTLVADGRSPAISPDGASLAYLAVEDDPLIGERRVTGLAIRDLDTGTTRLIAAADGADSFVHQPRGPINWSPDGRTIAVFDGTAIRLVDVLAATTLASQPTVPGDKPSHPISKRVYPPDTSHATPTAPTTGVPVITIPAPPLPSSLTSTSMDPVFLDDNTLVALYDCCIGYSHLVAFDLRTGRRTAFATVLGPPVSILRVGPSRLLVATAAGLLDLVTKGRTTVIAKGVGIATG